MKNLIRLLIAISTLSQCIFLYLLVVRNAPGLSSPILIATIASAFGGIFFCLSYSVIKATSQKRKADHGSVLVARLVIPALCCLILWIFLDATVTDYYQPLSLFDDAIVALAVSWAGLILALLLTAIAASTLSLGMLRSSLALALWGILGWPLAASLVFINQPVYGDAVADSKDIFIGGQGGYDIYRIPALLNLPAGSVLASGEALLKGRLLAFAEARRDGSLDTGVIDLVMRHSDDKGVTWSEQRLVCRHEIKQMRGKCGNATPLFDAQAGNIVLGYNLSGITQDKHAGRFHTAEIMKSGDGGLHWGPSIQVADDNFVFGPGHGIQKKLSPAKGRLLLPGYVNDHAIVLYSDDNGASWLRGDPLNTGNETELAELPDGKIYMTTRHRAAIGRPPEPNGRLYSLSSDGGVGWTETKVDTALQTPVCQASVLLYDDSLLLFSNPSHPKSRVNMEIKLSDDGGASWQRRIPVFSGPAGYSQLAQSDTGDVFVLFESGVMAYSERISLARIPAEAIKP